MTLRSPKYAIREEDFSSVYAPAAIRQDRARAIAARSRYELRDMQDPKTVISAKMAQVFEAVVLEESESSEWLGEGATTLKTTDHDDFQNHVDMIAEWHKPGEGSQVLALGVDATFGTMKLLEKFSEVRSGIELDKLASLRYYRDKRGNFMGTRNNVPRTIVGVSQPVVEELANLWVNGKKEALLEHPVQRLILVQLRYQLETQLKLAESLGRDNAAESIRSALAVIIPIEQAKRHIQLGALNDDPVSREILRHTRDDLAA